MTKRAVRPAAWPPVFVRVRRTVVLLAAGALLGVSCRPAGPPDATKTIPDRAPAPSERPLRPLSEVLREHAPRLMSLPGVVGVAEAALPDGSPCLRVYVVKRTPELAAQLPRAIEGWPVDVEESGPFRALDEPDSTGGGTPPR